MKQQIIIIGGGQAGSQAAVSLRQAGFDGSVTIFGAEASSPYQRPPLSKAFLKGETPEERLYLRPAKFYEDHDIELRLSERVVEIDRQDKLITTEKGDRHVYDKLLIATGAPPRRLDVSGAQLQNIFYLRTMTDSVALRTMLTSKGRVVIVGAGYIGLEVAAVTRKAGLDVVVLEMADRVLARVASEPVSDFYQRLHRDAGVDLRLGASLKRFVGSEGKLAGAELSTGEVIDCTAALIGVGASPATELAQAAGLEVNNGVVVDEYARTSDESIWAAGDCTNFPSPRYGRRMRLESVPNAIEQAKTAAANMIGGDEIYEALPWFWSDQYDVKLQTVGLMQGYEEMIVRGDPDDRRFSVWYLKQGKVLAVDCLNDGAAFMIAKKIIGSDKVVDVARLSRADTDLKSLL